MTTLIVFSHRRWNFVWQRPQQQMTRLAARHRIVFIEEPVRGERAQLVRSVCGPQLEVLVPQTPLEAKGFHDDQIALLQPLLENYLREQGIDDYVVWFYTPMALPLASGLRPRLVVYDCMDDLGAFRDAPRQLRQRESALLRLADLVLTGGPSLYEARRDLNPQVHCLPSAVDAVHFAPRADDGSDPHAAGAARLQRAIDRPRLGFFGVIDERVDLGLIDAVATAQPAWQLVMVGPVVKVDPLALPQRPNLHWLGMQPYERLPWLMAGWDLCLLPFAINDATRRASPSKTLEYLAGEKPVVASAIADVVLLYGELVRTAHGRREFIDACAATLAETPWQRNERLLRGIATVHAASWRLHVQCIESLLARRLAPPLAARPPAPLRGLAAARAS